MVDAKVLLIMKSNGAVCLIQIQVLQNFRSGEAERFGAKNVESGISLTKDHVALLIFCQHQEYEYRLNVSKTLAIQTLSPTFVNFQPRVIDKDMRH